MKAQSSLGINSFGHNSENHQGNNSMDRSPWTADTTYQICDRCVMDTSDPEISFNEKGVCSHCMNFDEEKNRVWFPGKEGEKRLASIVDEIKKEGLDKKYDSIMGLSGGVDSSFMAYQVSKLGLRPLVVHVDAGWNSELAVKNIENICRKLRFDLYTHVIDWAEIRDLQVAFFRSGVANQDVPQDHAFFASLYHFAVKNRIKYVLSGGNYATESVLPKTWGYNAMDSRHLKSIHKSFGKRKLKSFPIISFFQYYIYFRYIKGMTVIRPLNYLPYDKLEAKKILADKLGWRDYGCKHGESRFTRFFQCYFLPTRFGYDKRRAHLSSLILSGQMTRDEALRELENLPYDESTLRQDFCFITKKLGISEAEFNDLLSMPIRTHREYKSNEIWFNVSRKLRTFWTR